MFIRLRLRLKKTYFIVHAFVKTDGSHVEAKICEIFINRYQDIIHYGYCKVNLLVYRRLLLPSFTYIETFYYV